MIGKPLFVFDFIILVKLGRWFVVIHLYDIIADVPKNG